MFARFRQIVGEHLAAAVGPPRLSYTTLLQSGNVSCRVLKVQSMTRRNQFMDTLSTTTFLTVSVPVSDLRMVLSKAYGNLKVTFAMRFNNKIIATETMFGVVLNQSDVDSMGISKNIGEAEDTSIAVVTLELMSEAMWKLRLSQVGVNFQGSDGLTAARFILARTLVTGEAPVGEVERLAYSPYTEGEEVRFNSLVIPDSTPFLGVFDYIQNHYGIYGNGIGVYQHLKTWHIFRPWNRDRFKEEGERLVIYVVTADQLSQPEKSYRKVGNTHYIVVAGNMATNDNRDADTLNGGTGFRVGSLRSLDGRTTDANETGTSQTTPNGYMAGSSPTTHRSGLTNAPIVGQKFKDDDKVFRSEYARKAGYEVNLNWNGSIYGIIKPGMGVKIQYANDSSMFERYGTVLGEIYHTAVDGGGLSSEYYNSNSDLKLWIAN